MGIRHKEFPVEGVQFHPESILTECGKDGWLWPYAYGANIVRAERLLHGKTSPIIHDGKSIFKDLPNPFEATRYHSLLVEEESLPPEFEISAWTEEGEIMGIRHKEFPVEGVQFHPESILTECGKDLLGNFIDYYG